MTSAPRCQAITKSGKECSRNALPGSLYCWQHQNYVPGINNNINNEVKINNAANNEVKTNSEVNNEIKTSNEVKVNNQAQVTKVNFTPKDNEKLIERVMSQTHPDMHYKKNMIDYVNNLTYPIYLQINAAKTLDELIEKIKKILNGKLVIHAVSEAVRYYIRNKDLEKAKEVVIEYLNAEISELSGNVAHDYNKETINFLYINMAIANDEELYKLFEGKVMDKSFFKMKGWKLEGLRGEITSRKTISSDIIKSVFSQFGVYLSGEYAKFLKDNYFPKIYNSYELDEIIASGYQNINRYMEKLALRFNEEKINLKDEEQVYMFLNRTDLIDESLSKISKSAIGELSNYLPNDITKHVLEEYIQKKYPNK